MGYPYPRDATYTSPLQRPPFSSADQANNKYLPEDLTFQANYTTITPTIVTSFKIILYTTESALYLALWITNLSPFW